MSKYVQKSTASATEGDGASGAGTSESGQEQPVTFTDVLTGGKGKTPDGSEEGASGEPESAGEGEDQGEGQRDNSTSDPAYFVDPEAPYGYKADGSPRLSNRGRRPAGETITKERAKQKARLESVTPSRYKPQHPKPGTSIATGAALAVVNYQALGETAANLWINGGVMVLGDDWQPEPGDPLALSGAFRDYFKAKEIKDIPPGFALVMVLSIYTLKRAAKPTIKTKFQKVGLWFKEAVGRVRLPGLGPRMPKA